jgi:hypothetical protein
VRPFGFGYWAFDNHMVDLSVVVSLLSLIVKISVGASSNGEDCVMGGKVIILLCRLTDLQSS